MNVCIVDPYYAPSHQYWAEFLQKNLNASISIISTPPIHWKWKMEASAIQLADQVVKSCLIPDTFLVTDYLNLALFKSLLPSAYHQCRYVLYMHENQLTYPVSDKDTDVVHHRDNHYGWINYTSCLVADQILFNSEYHLKSFYNSLEQLSKRLPEAIDILSIKRRSEVLYLPFDIDNFKFRAQSQPKRIVWNHRWEYDKRPNVFLDTLVALSDEGYSFELVLLGNLNSSKALPFQEQLNKLEAHIIHQGYVTPKNEYTTRLLNSDIIISTAVHDFFGISVVEGILAGCQPILPFDLAYPEWIPEALHGRVFYHDKKSLRAMLKRSLSTPWTQKEAQECWDLLKSKLDWKILEARYRGVLTPHQ